MSIALLLRRHAHFIFLLAVAVFWLVQTYYQRPQLAPNEICAFSPDRAAIVADNIAEGHAYQKHVIDQYEFGQVISEDAFEALIEDTLIHPDRCKYLQASNSAAFWDEEIQLLVIYNPHDRDSGTAFRPRKGLAYFQKLQ